MVTMLNDRLDYFGSTVHITARLLELARPGDVMTTDAVTNQPEISRLIGQRGRKIEVESEDQGSDAAFGGLIVQRCSR